MSETEHSPEPWRWEPDGRWPGGALMYSAAPTGIDVELSLGDARRIVACVNACAGIPTEALEAGALAGALLLLDEVERDYAARMPAGWENHAVATLRALGRL